MKTPLLIPIGISFGGVIGFGLHSLVSMSEPTASSEKATSPILSENDGKASSEGVARPTVEEIDLAKEHEQPRLVSEYLKDATIEEVIALLDKSLIGKTSDRELQWIIGMRGLELNPDTLMAWARKRDSRDLITTLYEQWSIVDPHAALKASLDDKPYCKHAVLIRLVHGDPDRAIAAIHEFAPGAKQLEELERLKWGPLVKRNAKEALATASAIEDADERKRSIKAVAMAWAKHDPLAAIRWLDDQEALKNTDPIRTLAIEKLAETDLRSAYREIEGLGSSHNRLYQEMLLARKWAMWDPDGVLPWLESLPSGPRQDHKFLSILSHLELEPKAMLQFAKEHDIDLTQSELMMDPSMATREDESIDFERTLYPRLNSNVKAALLEIAEESPMRAFEELHSLGVVDFRRADEEIAELWIAQDSEGAANWIAKLPEGEAAQSFRETILNAWAKKAPADTAAFITANGFSPTPELVSALSRQWSREDPDAAISWTSNWDGDGNGERRDDILGSLLNHVGRSDPIKALQYVDEINHKKSQNWVISSATKSWLNHDPHAAMNWLVSQPQEAGMEEILSEVSKTWVSANPGEASKWISDMPNGLQKDRAVVGLIDALTTGRNMSKDFESAEVWIQTITDPQIREQWLSKIEGRRDP